MTEEKKIDQQEVAPSKKTKKEGKPKSEKKKSPKSHEKKLAPVKLKLLITVVNHKKTEFYLDFLQGYEINLQMVLKGRGTASNEMMHLLGLTDNEKSIILSVVREDRMDDLVRGLEDKFNTVNEGKGVAYAIPMTSTVGVAIYRFLSNNRKE